MEQKTYWIIDHYSSEPQYGGYTRQYNFARGLAALGYRVVVIASSFSHFKHVFIADEEYVTSEIEPNVHYVYLRTTPYVENAGVKRFAGMLSFLRAIGKYRGRIEECFGKPAWVLGSSPHPFSWIAAYRIARHYGAKFYAEVRDFWPLELRGENDNAAYKALYAYLDRLESWAFRKADKVICTLPYGDEYVCGVKGIDKSKCLIIGQPLDCVSFDRMAEENRDLLPAELCEFVRDSFFCVFAGYYKAYEGVYEMLEAAKHAKEKGLPIRFVFVGSGDEKDGMLAYAAENGLDNVLIGGRIEKRAIPALLRRSDICLAYLNDRSNPEMFRYGLSKNKLNEYLYSGAVTILGFPYSKNEVNLSGGGFTFDTDRNEFPELIEKIYRMNPEERRAMGEAGRSFVYAQHDIAVLSELVSRELLGGDEVR